MFMILDITASHRVYASYHCYRLGLQKVDTNGSLMA